MSSTPQKDTWFLLHSSCIPVQGREESLIYDIGKRELYPISSDHYELLQLCTQYSIPALKEVLTDVPGEAIDAFLAHFVDNHLGFYTTSPSSFPALDRAWDSPSTITNGIIKWSLDSEFEVKQVVQQLHQLGCEAVQLYLEDPLPIADLTTMIAAFEGTRIKLIDLLIPYDNKLDQGALFGLMEAYKSLAVVRIYNASENGILEYPNQALKILLSSKDIRLEQEEIITPSRFIVNTNVFMEAQHHNTGLNRKVCVDAAGNIKNYLNHTKIWGNITQVDLASVISKVAFQEKWFITNDEIEHCQDCMYRYCCISNADIEQKEGSYYKKYYCTLIQE